MAAQINYNDIQIEEGDQVISYSTEGWKAKRVFVANWVSNVDPTGTLYGCYFTGMVDPDAVTGLPIRGAPHPSIVVTNEWSTYMADKGLIPTNNAFCADLFTIKAITSTQVKLEVEYSVFTAENQEVSAFDEDIGKPLTDQAPALVVIGSSVQQGQTAADAKGQPIAFSYDAGDNTGAVPIGPQEGDWAITPQIGGPLTYTAYTVPNYADPFSPTPFAPGTPSIPSAANVQTPSTLIRFKRRESKEFNLPGYVGYINAVPWEIGDATYPEFTMLCTRIENETHDHGVSYEVTYEFQAAQPKPLADPGTTTIFPSELITIIGQQYISPWDVGGYYAIPSGVGNYTGSSPSAPKVIPANQAPPDCTAFIFRVYPSTDFNDADTGLHLTPNATPVGP